MKKQILIVDDEEPLANAIGRQLQRKDFQIHIRLSVDEALKVLESSQIDLCIVDLSMPEKTGFDFLKSIRRIPKFENLPVIVQSAFGSTYIKELLPYRPLRIFNKPMSTEDLLWTIQEALEIEKK